jgi:hypothetical protein
MSKDKTSKIEKRQNVDRQNVKRQNVEITKTSKDPKHRQKKRRNNQKIERSKLGMASGAARAAPPALKKSRKMLVENQRNFPYYISG